MAVVEVLRYPHPVLKTKCEAVTAFDETLKNLVQDMFDTMYADHGCGLAANQIGALQRIFVMDMSEQGNQPIILINPEVMATEGEQDNSEGCLSFPGIVVRYKRPQWVKMQAQNLNGETFTVEQEGYGARCLLHELDHLNGVTFLDHLSLLKRQMAEKKLKKYQRIAL